MMIEQEMDIFHLAAGDQPNRAPVDQMRRGDQYLVRAEQQLGMGMLNQYPVLGRYRNGTALPERVPLDPDRRHPAFCGNGAPPDPVSMCCVASKKATSCSQIDLDFREPNM